MQKISADLNGSTVEYCVENLQDDFVCPFTNQPLSALAVTKPRKGMDGARLCMSSIDMSKGLESYQQWLKKQDFVPVSVVKDMEVVSVQAALTPFYNFTGSVRVTWKGQKSENQNGKQHTSKLSGTTFQDFDVTVPAQSATPLSDTLMKGKLKDISNGTSDPFDVDALGDMANFVIVTASDDAKHALKSKAQAMIDDVGKRAARADCEGSLTSTNIKTTVDSSELIYALSYIVTYKYKGGSYIGAYVPQCEAGMGTYPTSKAQKGINILLNIIILAIGALVYLYMDTFESTISTKGLIYAGAVTVGLYVLKRIVAWLLRFFR